MCSQLVNLSLGVLCGSGGVAGRTRPHVLGHCPSAEPYPCCRPVVEGLSSLSLGVVDRKRYCLRVGLLVSVTFYFLFFVG